MSNKQALAEARRRWGKAALIEDKGKPTIHNGHVISGRFVVGRNMMGLFFEVKGDGASWEHAFAQATNNT